VYGFSFSVQVDFGLFPILLDCSVSKSFTLILHKELNRKAIWLEQQTENVTVRISSVLEGITQ
jgi:hypothetical protein